MENCQEFHTLYNFTQEGTFSECLWLVINSSAYLWLASSYNHIKDMLEGGRWLHFVDIFSVEQTNRL